MPILRGSPRTVSTVKEKDSEQPKTQRETRSSKSPVVCASSRLKDYKTSTKLTRAEIRSSAAARLSQRNKKKAEKEAKTPEIEHETKTDRKTESPLSPKKGSSTKSSETSSPDLRSKKQLDESSEKDLSLAKEENHENSEEKKQKLSEEYGSSMSEEDQSEDKGEGHRKRKQSLEEKTEPQYRKKQKHTFYEYVVEETPKKQRRKTQKRTFFEYVVEGVPSKEPRQEQNTEQVDEKMDTGGRRRSKRVSIPNTHYYKNFIDPSEKIPKLSDVEKSVIGSRNKADNEDKELDTGTKKSAVGHQKMGEFEAKPTLHQDKMEVIKWEVDKSGVVSDTAMQAEKSADEREEEEENGREEEEEEEDVSSSTTVKTNAEQITYSNPTASTEPGGTKKSGSKTVALGTTAQTLSDNQADIVIDVNGMASRTDEVTGDCMAEAVVTSKTVDLTPQEKWDQGPVEKSTEKQIKEISSIGTSESESPRDLEVTELPVVFLESTTNNEANDSSQLNSLSQDQNEAENSENIAMIEGPSESCIEIQGVTEEVNVAGASGEVQTSVDVYKIGRSVVPRERPGRICKQEVEEGEDVENQITGIETQKEKPSTAGTLNVVQNSEDGTKESQGTVTVQIINPKVKKKVETLDISVQADDLSENEDQLESSMHSDEKSYDTEMIQVEKSSADVQKSSTVITMPDGRSLTVTSADKTAFTFRTVPKTTISKQAALTPASEVRRITLPSRATGLRIFNTKKGAMQKIKPVVVSPDGDVLVDGTGESPETWNAVYKSSQVENQEIIVVSLPEGQELKQKFPTKPKKQDDVAYEMNDDGEFVCGVCNYKTSRKSNWYKHRKKHTGHKTHKCEYCNYVAATSSNLKRHQNIHLDVREHQCNQCGQTFRQKIHLERHIKYKHEEKAVKCPLCDYICANENPDLKVHIKRRHIPVEDDEAKEAKSYTCNECGLMTYSKKDMRQHMKFHKSGPELKLFCEQCSFVTDCESRLKRHVLIHSHERPYQCGLCDYRGSQKEHVLRHMKTQHHISVEKRSKKGFDMEDSDSKDSSSVDKQQDKSDYSSQEKIFACNHCSMKFSKLINLYKHLHGQHKEVLPQDSEEFLCVVCDFRTSSKKNLLVHMRKHNLVDQVPPSHVYSCVLCRYINPRRRNLFQHMKKKHGIEIVIRDDGSTSCFVTDSLPASEDTVNNMLTVGDIVTTATEESPELQIVTDNPSATQSVISIEDLAYAVSHPKPNTRILKEGTMKPRIATVVKEHEAAEAIEGLQALAGQPGIAHFTLDPQKQDNMETEVITMESPGEFVEEKDVEKESGYQLTSDQLMNLSTGDFVEINGEMYKVEISSEENSSSSQVDIVQTDIAHADIAQTDISLSEVTSSASHVVLSDIGSSHLEVSLVKDTQTENQILNSQSDSSEVPVVITQTNDVQMEDSQLRKSVNELKVPNQEEFPETKHESVENATEIPMEMTETCTQLETSVGNRDLTDRNQGMTATIEEVLMHVESNNIIGSGHTPVSQPMTSEGIVTSEILGIEQSEPIVAQGTFSTIDQEVVNEVEGDKVENAAEDQIMESSDIAELSSTLSAASGENNSQITESVFAETTPPENLQQEIDHKMPTERSDPEAMA